MRLNDGHSVLIQSLRWGCVGQTPNAGRYPSWMEIVDVVAVCYHCLSLLFVLLLSLLSVVVVIVCSIIVVMEV